MAMWKQLLTEWLITRDTDRYQQEAELSSVVSDSLVAGTMWKIRIKSELCS